MQHNAAEIWLNAMYVNALIFSQIGLEINIKSMHWQSRSALWGAAWLGYKKREQTYSQIQEP